MKKVLILGGTNFIGRNLVEQLQLHTAYDLTLFNRQKTDSGLFPLLKQIKGDRETKDVDQFTNQFWDFIIDLSCFYPNSLEKMLHDLEGKVGRYIFISTLSAYELDDSSLQYPIAENTPTLSCTESDKEDHTRATYGKRKAECERILLKAKWLDKIILRPSVVYGKYDITDRFYYWLYKAKNQETIMIPGNTADKITLTYVMDLVAIIMQSIEIKSHSVVYNVPTHLPMPISEMILLIEKNIRLININSETLKGNGILPESDIPLWFDSPLILSDEKLKADFKIQHTFKESIDQTIAYFSALNWPKPAIGIDILQECELMRNYPSQ